MFTLVFKEAQKQGSKRRYIYFEVTLEYKPHAYFTILNLIDHLFYLSPDEADNLILNKIKTKKSFFKTLSDGFLTISP